MKKKKRRAHDYISCFCCWNETEQNVHITVTSSSYNYSPGRCSGGTQIGSHLFGIMNFKLHIKQRPQSR